MQFNYHSARSRQARFRKILARKSLRVVIVLLTSALLVGWLHLGIYLGEPFADLLLVFVPIIMPVIWYNAHLKELPVNEKVQSIDDVLEPELLGMLPAQIEAASLAKLLNKTNGGRFFGARFAISTDFMAEALRESSVSVESVWQRAVELSRQYQEEHVSSAAVFVALLKNVPEHQFYLAQLKLGVEDIEAGLAWHEHIKGVIENSQMRASSGGFGRDLSFGYTPMLSHFGHNLSREVEMGGLLHRQVEGHEDVISQIVHVLSQPGGRNAALVGDVGAGKTTLVYALAQKLLEDKTVPKSVRYQQIIALDSATLIANARGNLEQLMIRLFNEAVKAKNVTLFLDDAQLFMQHSTGSVDLSNMLRQVLEGGALRIILAFDSQDWLALSQRNPGLAQLMNRVSVQPLNQADTLRVMEDQVLLMEIKHQATYMYQSLKEAYNLAERYVREQVFPGKAIKLLESAAGFKEQQYFVTEKSVQQAVEKTYGVTVQTASSVEDKDVLLNLEGKIHERMINQTRAVSVVSDALRRARAGVRNQQKPIGTFLFLGPTGVGKTELSKSLADVYFGGEDRLVRVDLNEYSSPNDTNRLLAPAAEDSMSLAAQIAKQPFSVVLLDEIEKAHPNVLNLLLQMLDEGVMRDGAGKPVNFKDAIIIATSNAGADEIRAHIEKGEDLEQFESAFIDELVNKKLFRPEFLNRFDEIVLFRPLTKEELMQVVDLILAGLNKTLAGQKVVVALTESAKQALVDAGYDPRLGARPLRRVMQRSIENIVAKALLSGQAGAGATFTIDAPDIQAALEKR